MTYKVYTAIASAFLLTACGGSGGTTGQPPSNASPTAAMSISSRSGYAPFTVTLDAAQSTDPDGTITSYAWSMGDGSSYVTAQVNHTYLAYGPFTASLMVTDDEGATDTMTVVVDVHAQVAGFYNGIFQSSVDGQIVNIYAQIGSNHQVYAADFVDWISGYSGTIDVVADTSIASLQAEIWDPAFTFRDGSQIGSISLSGTVTPRVGIDGAYNGVGDNGSYALTYLADITGRQASLAEVSGVWSWTDGVAFTETMTVNSAGAFTYVATDGCSSTGTLKIMDPTLNEYEIEYNMSCPPGVLLAGNGVRKGLARIEHADLFGYIDDWLAWDITYQSGPMAGRQGGYALARPPLLSATGGFNKQQAGRDRKGRLDSR